MKLIVYLCFLLGLGACGQKGPLYLPNKPIKEEKLTVITNNPNAKIKPEFIQFKSIIVSGKKAQIEKNTASAWQKMLVPLKNSRNLVRYVVFSRAVNNAKTPFAMTVGFVQKKNIKGQVNQKINTGFYLRFSSVEHGINQIPTLLNRVKEYFDNHKDIRHGKNKDFLVENKGRIDIYISMEKAPK